MPSAEPSAKRRELACAHIHGEISADASSCRAHRELAQRTERLAKLRQVGQELEAQRMQRLDVEGLATDATPVMVASSLSLI